MTGIPIYPRTEAGLAVEAGSALAYLTLTTRESTTIPVKEYLISIDPSQHDKWHRWNIDDRKSLTNSTSKNVSPFRVKRRRKKAKAARQARRRFRRQNKQL